MLIQKPLAAIGAGAAVLLCLGLATASPDAQIPKTFTNLQVLPADIAQADLIAEMRGFARGLGVRCNHCHVGPDNLEGMDFATDEKATKRAARTMLRMVRAINAEHISALPAQAEARMQVTCATCHQGMPKPMPPAGPAR